jgi:predicted permease
VFTTGVALPESRYEGEAEFRAFGARALERLEAVAGVTAVGMSTNVPFSGNNNSSVITIDGQVLAPGENPPVPHFTFATGRYLEALGIPLLEGRFFESTDTADTMPVVVIDRRMADLYWPNESPLGKRLRQGVPNPEDMGVEADPWSTVIGVVGNIKNNDLAELDDVGTLYFSLVQNPQRSAWFIVRSELPEGPITSAVRREVQALDPELPLYFDTEMLETRMNRALLGRRAPMTLLMVFAGIALFLSAVGIYGVLAHSVSQRTKEIGIRMALGAEPNQVLLQTLWQGGRLIAVGLVVGIVGAVLLGRLVANLLYGVTPTDPGVFALVIALLGTVAVVACVIPSHRATRVSAVTSLRHE